MEIKKFKKLNKPSTCTLPPWAVYILPRQRPEILRIIRQETIDYLGYHLDECPKRKVCITKSCLGRPLPWKSKTAKPYLDKLAKSLNIKNGEDLYINTDCRTCPFYTDCENPCNQVLDFIEREKSLEPDMNYKETLEYVKPKGDVLEPVDLLVNSDDIPWDVLSERKKKVIKKYLYEQRDFRYVAESEGFYNQAAAKYEFYSALNKLSEYGVFRKFITEYSHLLTPRQYEILTLIYLNNKKIVQVAAYLGISKQSVQQTVARVIKKHNIKWKKFVRKQGNKTIYTTAEVLK